MTDNEETPSLPPKFDFEAFAADTLFIDRRAQERRRARTDAHKERKRAAGAAAGESPAASPAPERRAKQERRRRIDPTTFEKQYTDDELEFMNAMQRFKVQTGRSFPTHGEVLQVARALGYRRKARDGEPVPAAESDSEGPPSLGNPFE